MIVNRECVYCFKVLGFNIGNYREFVCFVGDHA